MAQSSPRQRSWSRGRVIVAGLAGLVTVVLIALMVRDLGTARSATSTSDARPPHHQKPAASAVQSRVATTEAAEPAPTPTSTQIPPWEATPENTPAPPEGYIPAWQVEQVAPEPLEPPAMPELIDPLHDTPPIHNPGGVNGDRPPRDFDQP